jgi:tetratricopeptide (TPR) repeat protein
VFWLIPRVLRDFKVWEKSTQTAFIMALILLMSACGLLAFAPQTERLPILIGIGSLITMLQLITMWGNRHMVTAYTQAQRHFMAGDFEAACAVLEQERAQGHSDMRALTLLGHSYRRVGKLDASERVLYEALDKSPNHNFPLYGLGRTMLIKGDYERAVEYLKAALAAGAPPITQFDLAEAYFRQGKTEQGRGVLQQIMPVLDSPAVSQGDESYRTLMAHFWMELPIDRHLLASGLPYWQALAILFATLPYGQAVADEVAVLQRINEGAVNYGTES